MSTHFQRGGGIMKWLKQKKPGPELKRFMEESQAVKTSLDKLKILNFTSSGRLKENVGRKF